MSNPHQPGAPLQPMQRVRNPAKGAGRARGGGGRRGGAVRIAHAISESRTRFGESRTRLGESCTRMANPARERGIAYAIEQAPRGARAKHVRAMQGLRTWCKRTWGEGRQVPRAGTPHASSTVCKAARGWLRLPEGERPVRRSRVYSPNAMRVPQPGQHRVRAMGARLRAAREGRGGDLETRQRVGNDVVGAGDVADAQVDVVHSARPPNGSDKLEHRHAAR